MTYAAGRRLPRLIVPIALAAGVVVTLALALTAVDSFDRTGGGGLAFGRPLTWIVQDQRASDPPPHAQVGLGSPWEDPTQLHLLAALADVAIFALPTAVVLGALWSLARRARRPRRTS